MSITSVFTIGPFVPLQNPKYASDVNMPLKQNDGTWVEKHQRFLYNVYKRFFLFLSRFFTFFSVFIFFLKSFFTSMTLMTFDKQSNGRRIAVES